MTREESIFYLQAILDDTLDSRDESDARRIEAVEYALEKLKGRNDVIIPMIDQKLKEYSAEHIAYEIMMFRETATLLMLGRLPPGLPMNIVVESFAIHVRTLISFFSPRGIKADDVVAEHYLPDKAASIKLSLLFTSTLEEARERGSKEVGHLTTKRITGTPPEKNWPVKEIYTDLVAVITAFASLALSQRLDQRVRDEVKKF